MVAVNKELLLDHVLASQISDAPFIDKRALENKGACKRKEEQQVQHNQPQPPKKPRLVFTDIQRRTLQAIFKETKRPSREMQLTISQQLGLDPTT
ncbi:unnamed protein product, partial [Strongylus vulgaris]